MVLVTSAMVYGSQAPHEGPLGDDAEVLADPDDSVLGDLVEMEAVVERARRAHPWLEISVLRPAPLVGPGIDSVVTRHFEAPRLLVLRGSAPLWQFCHVDDLVSALETAALGPYLLSANVAGDGWLSQDDVERVSGLRRIELPASVAISTAERLHRIGITPAASSELSFLVHPLVVTTEALTGPGWRRRSTTSRRSRCCWRSRRGTPRSAPAGSTARTRRGRRRRRRRSPWWARRLSYGGPASAGAADGRPPRSGCWRSGTPRSRSTRCWRRWPTRGPGAWPSSSVRCATTTATGPSTSSATAPTRAPRRSCGPWRRRSSASYPVYGLAAVHRTGDLAVGEVAVVVAVSCAHRGEAFDAARALIDELKAQVPLWKHQRFADGDAEWVGSP